MAPTKKVASKEVIAKKTTVKKTVASKRTTKKKPPVVKKKTEIKKAPRKKTGVSTKKSKTSFVEKLETAQVRKLNDKTSKSQTKQEKGGVLSLFRLKKPALRNTMQIAAVSPYRFPVSLDTFAVQTARIGGLAFVIMGGLFTMLFSQQVWNSDNNIIAQYSNTLTASLCLGLSGLELTACEQQESLDQAVALRTNELLAAQEANIATTTETTVTDTTTTTVTDTTTSTSVSAIESVGVSKPPAIFTYNQSEPFSDTVLLKILVDSADKIDVLVFKGTYANPISLGKAIPGDSENTWVYRWDTTAQEDDRYRIAVDIYNPTNTTEPYRQTHVYKDVINNPTPVAAESDPAVEINKKPAAKFTLSSNLPVTNEAIFSVEVQNAKAIKFIAIHKTSGSENTIGRAVSDPFDQNLWTFRWDTTKYLDGEYKVVARIANEYSNYTGGSLSVVVENSTPALDNPPTSVEDHLAFDLPEISISLDTTNVLKNTVTLQIETQNPKFVELYKVREGSKIPIFIGLITNTYSDDVFYFDWNTKFSPNGNYKLFAKVKNKYGEYTSDSVSVAVYNTVEVFEKTDIQKDTLRQIEIAQQIDTQQQAQIIDTLLISSSTEVVENIVSSTSKAKTIDIAIDGYTQRLHEELNRLASAYRSDDQVRIDVIQTRIDVLKEDIFDSLDSSEKIAGSESQINNRINGIVKQYKKSIKKTDTIISERVSQNIYKDSDSDNVSDYDEITIYNTDPFSADSDGDGFNDGVEIQSGYNPTDPQREVAIVFESPKETGVVRSDVLEIVSIEAVASSEEQTDAAKAVITGIGLPNSFVTIYIYSNPVIVTVKTDSEGAWEYRFDKELEDGEHEIFAGVTDNAGRIVAKSNKFTFIKEAKAYTSIDAAIPGIVDTAPANDSLLSQYMVYLILSISVVSIGLVLILLGLHLDTRGKRYPEIVTKEE